MMKTLFVGSGSIGKRHIMNLSRICDENSVLLQTDLLRSSHKPIPEDINELVTDTFYSINELPDHYDAIFIANPTYLHYETICELKDRSKKFFVEKPLFNNEMHTIAEMHLPSDNLYYVACPLRYTGILQYAKKFFKNKTPFAVRAVSSSYLPDWRPGVDYRTTYSAHRSQGGGVGIDLIHEWDYMTYLFGNPLEVVKFSGKYSDLEIDSDDIACYIGRYQDFLAEIHLDYFGRKSERKLEAQLEDGKYIFDILNGNVEKDSVRIASFEEDPNDKYLAEMRHFLSIRVGSDSENDLDHALYVQSLAV